MKIKMYLDMESVRNLCIKQDWCTHMDIETYADMLFYAEQKACTAEHIEVLANWIAMNSDIESDDPARTVAYYLLNCAVRYDPE